MPQTYSPFRSTATIKPQSQCPPVDVYLCPTCGRAYQALGYGEHAAPECCGAVARRLEPVGEDAFPPGYKVSYRIVGGLNHDAVHISWRSPDDASPDWVLLRTFSGSYIRYPAPGRKPPMIFPMADEDAYVYCDKKVCERCTFRCKRGFEAYVFFARPAPLLLAVSLDKLAPRFRTPV